MNIGRELEEIGELLASASLLSAVRKEVMAIKRDGIMVTDSPDGRHDILIRVHKATQEKVARRIRARIPDIEVERIADNLLGVRDSRRTR